MFCLSLDRTPAAEMLPGTAQAWLEAITDGKAWDERRDADRIRAAFRVLAKTARRWPAPAEFLESVPPVPPLAAIGYERKPASPEVLERARKAVEALAMGVVTKTPPARVEHTTTKAERDRLEAEARLRYGSGSQ